MNPYKSQTDAAVKEIKEKLLARGYAKDKLDLLSIAQLVSIWNEEFTTDLKF